MSGMTASMNFAERLLPHDRDPLLLVREEQQQERSRLDAEHLARFLRYDDLSLRPPGPHGACSFRPGLVPFGSDQHRSGAFVASLLGRWFRVRGCIPVLEQVLVVRSCARAWAL
ncbi:hypothetical protein ACZ91_46980, partial [Streptomyces regensis]